MAYLYHGFIPDGTVRDTLVRLLPLCSVQWIAVIRSIDSAYDFAQLKTVVEFHQIPFTVVNGNICISIGDLRKALRDDVFTGFDEVWIVSDNPPSFDLGSMPTATSDAADFSTIPDELYSGIVKARCVLVLGDGCGLNYLATDPHLASQIMR